MSAETVPGRSDSGHRRIDDIEVLRAFAVGLVLVEHLPWNLLRTVVLGWGPVYGVYRFWSGVDLFLAISGFVIARGLLPRLAATRGVEDFFNTTLSFWIRRGWRLLPSAWLWLAVILVCSVSFNRSGSFEPILVNIQDALAAVLNLENFRVAYVFQKYPLGAASVYWTLSLEEQFYIVLPFLAFFARRRLPWVLAVIVALQLFVKRNAAGADALLGQIRSDALSLGVLLAIWSGCASYRKLEPGRLMRWPVRVLLPPVFIYAFTLLSGPHFEFLQCRVGLIALMAIAIVWLASYDQDYIVPPGALKRGLCWVGTRSYAIYLIHMPVYRLTREIWFRIRPEILLPGHGREFVLIATAWTLVLVLADLNYRWVELPLRRRGAQVAEDLRRRDLKPLIAPAGAAHA